jgi:glycosyltransferase involved in cell wall biosynthesis
LLEALFLRVCVISPNRNLYSETFIRAHIERLPFEIVPLYGSLALFVSESGGEIGRKSAFLDRQLKAVKASASRIPRLTDLNFAKWLWKYKIDCVLAEYGPAGVDILEPCCLAGVPIVVHFHGFDASHGPTLARHHDSYPKLFKQAAKIVAVSQHMFEALSDLGAPRTKLVLNPYGVDPDRFNGSAPASSAPTFLAVGRFCETKAPFLTILAFADALKRRPTIRLKMVGDGELFNACKTLTRALNIDAFVEFLGPRSPSEIQELMRESRAFLQHSVVTENGDSEGTPVGIIEAQMSGLPVISTRHAGIPDVVVEGETGLLVTERDIGAMAEAILALIDQPELAGRMGAAGRARALAYFRLDQHIDKLAAIIQTSVVG